jgi:hypothetical protein
MSHSEVPNIELSKDGRTVTLYVRVTGFEADTPVEISGYATQTNGAIATFHEVLEISSNKKDVFQVKDVPVIPPNGFVEGEPITVVARAADVWITKLVGDQSKQQAEWIKAAWKSDNETFHSAWSQSQRTPSPG